MTTSGGFRFEKRFVQASEGMLARLVPSSESDSPGLVGATYARLHRVK